MLISCTSVETNSDPLLKLIRILFLTSQENVVY